MMTSSALVLMMTIPGLALFYAGMVRKKNVLATLMQVFTICCAITVSWMVLGYSLAFTDGGAYVGDLSRAMLGGMTVDGLAPLAPTIPESVYMMFQMTFAIITPALIVGAFVDRMRFGPMVVFMVLWSLIVYSPIAHWVWDPKGFLFNAGVLDFAGGTVVHINAGIAGLVCALVLGKRLGYGHEPMAPHNLALTMIGASLLWVGWFGFNAGSAVTSGGRAGMAFAATHIATAGAALGLDGRRVAEQRQAVALGHRLGRRGRAGRHHPGFGLRPAQRRAHHRHRRRRGLLLGCDLAQEHAGL